MKTKYHIVAFLTSIIILCSNLTYAIAFNPEPGDGFSLVTDTPSVTVCTNVDTATYNFNVLPIANFAGTVELNVENVPEGASVGFLQSKISISGNTSVVMTITNLLALTNGSYNMRVKAYGCPKSEYVDVELVIGCANDPLEYCSSSGNVQYVTGITNVKLNTIDYSDLVNNNSPYEDFSAISTSLEKGETYNLSINLNTSGNYAIYAIVWFDWNQDGDFDDADETYQMGEAQNSENGETSLSPRSITIPEEAAFGTTKMRVSAKYNMYPTSCENNFDGEVEDYSVVIENTSLDTSIPIITLNGNETVILNLNSTYDELGAVAVDDYDGDITSNIVYGGDTVNTQQLGTYQITYNVTDASGNAADEVIRTITVQNPIPVILSTGYFETGWDGWIEGGADVKRVKSKKKSCENSYSIRLRDNSNENSAMTSEVFDLRSYNSVEIAFQFYPKSMENGEDFWLRYNDGMEWQTIATYVSGIDFNNKDCYTASFILNASEYNFTDDSQFRFQCDASGNNDQIFVDAVVISAISDNVIIPKVSTNSNRDTVESTISKRYKSNSVKLNTDIILYPNPVSHSFNIKSNNAKIESVLMFSMDGSLVKQVDNLGSQDFISVSNLKSGLYFVVIKTGSFTVTKKLIKY